MIDVDAVDGCLVQFGQDQVIESRAVGLSGARDEVEVVVGVVGVPVRPGREAPLLGLRAIATRLVAATAAEAASTSGT